MSEIGINASWTHKCQHTYVSIQCDREMAYMELKGIFCAQTALNCDYRLLYLKGLIKIRVKDNLVKFYPFLLAGPSHHSDTLNLKA